MSYAVSSPGCAGGSVAVYRLRHDVVIGHLRQLLLYEVEIIDICVYKDILFRQDFCKALIGLLQLCLAASEKVDKLFRMLLSACGP